MDEELNDQPISGKKPRKRMRRIESSEVEEDTEASKNILGPTDTHYDTPDVHENKANDNNTGKQIIKKRTKNKKIQSIFGLFFF